MNIVKFSALVVAALTSFFFWSLQSPSKAVEVHPLQEKQGYSSHEEDNLPDQIANIFLEQGWIGAMLLLVMAYMHYSQKTARADRIKLEDKLVDMLTNSNNVQLENVKELTKIGSELENMGRELERIRG